MPSDLADHLRALGGLTERLEDAGVDVEEIQGITDYDHRDGLRVDLRLGVPATLGETSASTTGAEEDAATDDTDAGGGSAVEARGDDTDEGDEGGGESPPETRCADGELLATTVARDYGLSLTGDVLEHVDADRVTVVDQPYGADLVPGADAEGPDYAVGETKIQLGGPGVDVIGVEPDEDVHVVQDDGIRLEAADVESGSEDSEDGNGQRFWCGACARGPFETEQDVRDHHDRAGQRHTGVAIVKTEDPADIVDELSEEDGGKSRADGGGAAAAASTPTTTDSAAGATCQNCGSHVTADYARVFTPDDEDDPRVCPECEDKIRDGPDVRFRRDKGQHKNNDT